MGAWERLRDWRWRLAGHGRPLGAEFTEPLHRATLLEVGGPSAVFTDAGLLPAYALAAAVHGLQWSTDTVWHGRQDPGDYAPAGVPLGRMLVSDDPDLAQVADGSYDGVISSHVIEHLANPLRALATWRRITRAGGLVLLIAPHREGTFDRHRPVTSLGHVISDHRSGTAEDDSDRVPRRPC